MPSVVWLAGAWLCACESEPEPRTCDLGGDVGASVAASSAVDRHLIGVASPYPADATLRARMDELAASQRAR
ncbi:MAG: hypothetical protein IT378_09095, partial [Sandaracinaceae bacterium]|nr:hypothetical protein [Sandaracinaceae bacterium]